MATDVFMDMLTARTLVEDAKAQRAKHVAPRKPEPPQSPANGYPDTLAEQQAHRPRPDYADDIDRIVTEMVAAGFVVFDHETQTYRRPNVRRWRFA